MTKHIFLSASVPDPQRNPIYFESADIIAIRDAVCALAQVVLPTGKLVWGGHPMITPLIRVVAESLNIDTRNKVVLYQSLLFVGQMPQDNEAFEQIIYTPNIEGDRNKSLYEMRRKMMTDYTFHAGVFIGGMEGIEDEFRMFKEFQPNAIALPVASTGAAAKIVYDNTPTQFPNSLATDYAYLNLFKELLNIA